MTGNQQGCDNDAEDEGGEGYGRLVIDQQIVALASGSGEQSVHYEYAVIDAYAEYKTGYQYID